MTSPGQNCLWRKSRVGKGQTGQDTPLAPGGGQTDCGQRFNLSNPDIRYHPPAIAAVVPPVTVSATYFFSVLEYALYGEVTFQPCLG